MNDGQGAQMVCSLPVTWIPVDLTTQATKSAILSSPNFRRMLQAGVIKLISDELAELTMRSPKAQAEATRVYSRVQGIGQELMPAAAATAAAEAGGGGVSGLAMQLAMADDLEEDQVMTTLEGNAQTMTEADMRYLAANSRFPRVKEFAASQVTG